MGKKCECIRVLCVFFFSLFFVFFTQLSSAENIVTGEGPNLGNLENRITQEDIESGLSLKKTQDAGLRIFTTPFNRLDGYGDGNFPDPAEDPNDAREFGSRPSLQNNGTFLRVNGLDGQTCLECHFITRNSTIPATFGIAGVAAGASHPIFRPSYINVADNTNSQVIGNPGDFNGRFINPPFLFGSGGIELVAKEMTIQLQNFIQGAKENPGEAITLETKGVNFGHIVYIGGALDTANIEGIDDDLVVRPFGRKGEFATVRAFDLGAMEFHFGIQPVEVLPDPNLDADNDGVTKELLIGEISALHIFLTTRPKPVMDPPTPKIEQGFKIFHTIGCVDCHRPFFTTESKALTYSFPEEETDPTKNIYYEVDLVSTAHFLPSGNGVMVPSFSDLKRHDMGPGLAESFDEVSPKMNREFITARLWGVRDTAPYLHDGRATTITDAILAHGGEALDARQAFNLLSDLSKEELISFLYSLRTPLSNSQVNLKAEGALLLSITN